MTVLRNPAENGGGGWDPWIIDGDGHVREPWDELRRHLPSQFHTALDAIERHGAETDMFGLRPYASQLSATQLAGGHDPAVRIADMDTDGIVQAVLYPTVGLIIQGITERAPSRALARAVNDWVAEYCAHDPARLLGVGVVPVVDGDDAVEEARRCVEELGFVGVFRRPEATDVLVIHDPAFEPLWEYLASVNVPIAIHSAYNSFVRQPYFMERFPGSYIPGHAASFVVEAMNALNSFVFYGILERHPALRVGLVECGAVWAMAYCHRLDEHVKFWPMPQGSLPLKPSDYFARQVYVSVEEYEPGLDTMMELYPHNVVFESDYPHPDATFPGSTTDLLEETNLSSEQVRAVLRDNSLRLYGLEQRVSS